MKSLVKKTMSFMGGHIFSDDSLPTGVHWLHDIQRLGACSPNPVCFDVGANVGQTVKELRRVFPKSPIHAFEPFAGTRAKLVAATHEDPLVKVVPLAMGSAPAILQARPNPESLMSSLVATSAHASNLPIESIQIGTLDAYCKEQGIQTVDVLKTDTEGYDLEVLKGAEGLLAAQRVGYIYVEVTFIPEDDQHTGFPGVFQLLSSHGYDFLGLYETYPLHFFPAPTLFCNALFLARSMREPAVKRRRAAESASKD
jgi:FkbM family methyltransferase